MFEGFGVSVGDMRSEVVIENLSRTQIVMYAGASGDYNPLHTDELFATRVAGYPTVFAHGMLTMGATGRVVTDWFGVENLTHFSARFLSQVWPGDTLTTSVQVTDILERHVEVDVNLEIVTENQLGAKVLSGTAKVTLSRKSPK
jgi:acyl dehydratase